MQMFILESEDWLLEQGRADTFFHLIEVKVILIVLIILIGFSLNDRDDFVTIL